MKHIYIIILALLAFSCTQKLYVAPRTADCSVGGRGECYLIKSSADDNWVMIAEDIVGFEYEEGFVYRVLVKKIKVVDDFGTERSAYQIVEILEKNPYTGKKVKEEETSIKSTDYSLTRLVHGGTEMSVPENIVLSIDLEKKQISGNGGCNNFFGPIAFDGTSNVTIGPLGMTRKLCAGEELNQFENLYVKTLGEVHSVLVENNIVKLLTPSEDLLEYEEN